MISAKPIKVIIHVREDGGLALGTRAVKWLMDHPERKDALISYGEKAKDVFWVQRNRGGSITARRSFG